jgi:hypothetical protein
MAARAQVVMVEALPHNANHILHSLRRNGLDPRLCTDLFLVRNAVAAAASRRFAVVYDEANVRRRGRALSPPHTVAQIWKPMRAHTSVHVRLQICPHAYTQFTRTCAIAHTSLMRAHALPTPIPRAHDSTHTRARGATAGPHGAPTPAGQRPRCAHRQDTRTHT